MPTGGRTRLRWPDVLRVLQTDETRSRALEHYSAGGRVPDDFGHRRPAREAMADAVTATEDWLEMQAVDRPGRAHLYDAERRHPRRPPPA